MFYRGWWRGLRPYYTLKLKACQRLIVGRNLEYCRYVKFSSPTKPIRDGRQESAGINPTRRPGVLVRFPDSNRTWRVRWPPPSRLAARLFSVRSYHADRESDRKRSGHSLCDLRRRSDVWRVAQRRGQAEVERRLSKYSSFCSSSMAKSSPASNCSNASGPTPLLMSITT